MTTSNDDGADLDVLDDGRLARAVVEARERIAPYVRRTSVVRADDISRRVGGDVHIKPESRQVSGSFKARPAFAGLLAHLVAARDRGVVTSSSGNFAVACAHAARELDIALTVVMTSAASGYKANRARALGARIVTCEDRYEARQETVDRLRTETGAVELHPHDSLETVAGDATVGLEIAEDIDDAATVVVPASGGGLLGGVAWALRSRGFAGRIVGVQPVGNPALVESYRAAERRVIVGSGTIADGLTASCPGRRGFALARRFVDEMVTVSDEAMLDAMVRMHDEEKLVVEPAGVAGIAVLEDGRLADVRFPVAVVLTGGNTDRFTQRS